MKILAIIPARGGSIGIPRKNVRPLNNKPLISYAINVAANSQFLLDIFVSSDDDEILMFASRFGANTHKRDKKLADAETTLDPVIFDVYHEILTSKGTEYDFVITLQPTSPLLSSKTLDEALRRITTDANIDTLLAVKEQRKLSWKRIDNKYIPNYSKRVNRQYIESIYEETGAFVICKAKNLLEKKIRITGNVDLFIVPKHEAIDIDDYSDWALCEFYLKRKRILFNITGNELVGLGHVYRSLTIAYDILDHEIVFLVDSSSHLAMKKIMEYNFRVHMQEYDNILDDIKGLAPDLVINDVLDTDEEFIRNLKLEGIKVINFEDLGSGTAHADLVVNALYPSIEPLPRIYSGYKYFCARDEFINTLSKKIEDVRNVLVSFGGTDSNNLTFKVLNSIFIFCRENNIDITVIEGLGYHNRKSIESFQDITIVNNISNISEYFHNADIIFTSAGRTVYEIACIGTPTIIMAQNMREMTHLFSTARYGFINLGLGIHTTSEEILTALINLTEDINLRKKMQNKMLSFDLKGGKQRTVKLIRKIIEEIE